MSTFLLVRIGYQNFITDHAALEHLVNLVPVSTKYHDGKHVYVMGEEVQIEITVQDDKSLFVDSAAFEQAEAEVKARKDAEAEAERIRQMPQPAPEPIEAAPGYEDPLEEVPNAYEDDSAPIQPPVWP